MHDNALHRTLNSAGERGRYVSKGIAWFSSDPT